MRFYKLTTPMRPEP